MMNTASVGKVICFSLTLLYLPIAIAVRVSHVPVDVHLNAVQRPPSMIMTPFDCFNSGVLSCIAHCEVMKI